MTFIARGNSPSSSRAKVVAPISTYSVDEDEYLVVMAREGANQQTPNLPKTHGGAAFRLNVTTAQTNSGAG